MAEAEREKRVAVVAAEMAGEQQRIAADVDAYKKKTFAEAAANAVRAEAQGAAESVKIKAQAEADAAALQALSITKLAEAHREAGIKEAEVQRAKVAAQNGKTRDILLEETVLSMIQQAPEIIAQLVKPAERIGEIKVLQLGGGAPQGAGNGAQPFLGNALGPMMKTILETSAMMPMLKDALKFADTAQLAQAVSNAVGAVDPARVVTAPSGKTARAASRPVE